MIATCDGSRRWVAGAHPLRGSPRVDAFHFGGFCKASAPPPPKIKPPRAVDRVTGNAVNQLPQSINVDSVEGD